MNQPLRTPAGRALVLLLQLAALAALIAAVQYYWGWRHLFQPWRTVEPAALAGSVAVMLASYGIRALRIYLAEPEVPRGAYLACLRLILLNNALNLLLPMRSGEASFPLLLRRWFGIGSVRATGILVWLRLLDLQVLASLALVIGLQLDAPWLRGPLRAGGWAIAALVLAAPLALFAARERLRRHRASRAGRLLSRLLEGLPERAGGVARDLGLTATSWTIKLAGLGWVLHRLAGVSWPMGALGAIGGDLSTVLPIHAPGGFGTYEAGVLAAVLAGQPATRAALAGAVNLHLLVLTTALLAGLAAWLLPGRPVVDSPANGPHDAA